jgi:hypothetical protein
LVESQNIGCAPTEEIPSTPTAIPATPRGNACDLPLRTATATVEVTIASSEDINTRYVAIDVYVAFCKGNESLLMMRSTECTAKQTGNEQVVYHAVANMDVSDAAFGEPVRFFEEAEYIQIRFLPMPEQSQVIEGKITCIFNSETLLEVSIPAQDTTEGRIFVRDLDVNCGSN